MNILLYLSLTYFVLCAIYLCQGIVLLFFPLEYFQIEIVSANLDICDHKITHFIAYSDRILTFSFKQLNLGRCLLMLHHFILIYWKTVRPFYCNVYLCVMLADVYLCCTILF